MVTQLPPWKTTAQSEGLCGQSVGRPGQNLFAPALGRGRIHRAASPHPTPAPDYEQAASSPDSDRWVRPGGTPTRSRMIMMMMVMMVMTTTTMMMLDDDDDDGGGVGGGGGGGGGGGDFHVCCFWIGWND